MNKKSTSVSYQRTETTYNADGEKQEEKQEIVYKIPAEPEFIKVYYETMLAFNQIHDVPLSFVLSLSKFVEWTNDGEPMCVTINKRVREIMIEDVGVKIAQINRYIATSVKNGLLFRTEYKSVYEVNPFMIAKGKWSSIRSLQCKFNFKDGKWTREIEEKLPDQEAEQIIKEMNEMKERAEKAMNKENNKEIA